MIYLKIISIFINQEQHSFAHISRVKSMMFFGIAMSCHG